MRFAGACRQCGQVRVFETKDVHKFVFKCFSCGNKTKLKNKSYLWFNMDVVRLK